jgi:hypothetical protein
VLSLSGQYADTKVFISDSLFKVGAKVINLLGFKVLIEDSKNCPLKSS